MRIVVPLLFAVLLGLPAAAEDDGELRHFNVDRCLGKKCKNGRIDRVTVTPEHFIVQINPNRCVKTPTYHCPTSYASFTVDGETPARVKGYAMGEKSVKRFTVYVPREYKALHIMGINDSERFATVDLTLYEVSAKQQAEAFVSNDGEGPQFVLTSPPLENGYFVTEDTSVEIAGQIGGLEGVTSAVAVNGVVVPVAADGTFSTEVALSEGRNTFAVSIDLGARRVKRVIVVERR
ncbi:MAG: hypothetical protein ACYS0F_15750 [Planctomycetota bacterium]|jgi:hypothetical protein